MSIYKTISKLDSQEIIIDVACEHKPSLAVTAPPEFQGPQDMWSPEDLFSASISSCYILTFRVLANLKKMKWEDISVEVDAQLEKTQSGYQFTKAIIKPTLKICCSFEVDPYLKLLHQSKDKCLVTNSMSCEFEVIPKIKVTAK